MHSRLKPLPRFSLKLWEPLPRYQLELWERLFVQGRTYVAEDRTSESDQPRMSNTENKFMGQQ